MNTDGVYPCYVKDPLKDGRSLRLVAPNMTSLGRTVYGMKWSQIRSDAEVWWNKQGRHNMLQLKGAWRDPDEGFDSSILRGLEWAWLNATEQAKVTRNFEEEQVRKRKDVREALLAYMVLNHPATFNDADLAKAIASLPDADQRANNLVAIDSKPTGVEDIGNDLDV
ncbi:MAG: hypothetical protein Unbinned4026contig1001_33 [Prokaryotic dsDNA virus sp.]|nr:MAG: hypothetical protein Unbinned4026contig1001_33 [Prokaryotic dsDNA virus sp.]